MSTNMTGFWMVLKNICVIVLWTKVASAWEGLAVFPLQMIDGLIFPYFGHCTHAVVGIGTLKLWGDFPPGLEQLGNYLQGVPEIQYICPLVILFHCGCVLVHLKYDVYMDL